MSYGFNSASNTQDTNNLSSSLILNREFGNLSQDNAVVKSEISLQNANYTLAKTQDNLNEELKDFLIMNLVNVAGDLKDICYAYFLFLKEI